MRYALALEYDGTDFLGWQRLSHGRTVQAALEQALSFVADRPVEVVCAGRTDAGVHAQRQVVHFDTDADREPRAFVLGSNSRLPASIAVLWAQPVDDSFHARYGARARRYVYRLLNRPIRPGLQSRFLSWERRPLDAGLMHQAAQSLLGEHDFSAFRTSQCQARHPVRTVQRISVARRDDVIAFDIQANAFLHHMVRNMVGSLLLIGRGERPVDWLGDTLAGGDRRVAGPTAAAAGLTFCGPLYPPECGLPDEYSVASDFDPRAAERST